MKLVHVVVGIVIVAVLFSSLLIPIVDNSDDDPSTLDVIIIDGQSNAEYSSSVNRVNAALVDLPQPHHKLMYYGTLTGPSNYADTNTDYSIYEMNRGGYWKIGGLEPSLSYYYSERAGHDVLTINVARGAQSISWLSPSGAGGQYAAGIIQDALSKVSGYANVHMVGWVMAQGEQDKEMAVDTYKAYFLSLEMYFQSIGAENCYISATREYYGGNATIAQDELANSYGYIHIATEISNTFTESNGLLVNGDPIHYSQLGRNLIGKEIGQYINVPQESSFNMIHIIPVLVMVGIVLGIVRLFTNYRD